MTLTPTQIQLIRSDVGDTTHPLFLHNDLLQAFADLVANEDNADEAVRVYALRSIVARMAHDRDPRLKDYNEMLEKWEMRANMNTGAIQTGIIDLNLIAPLGEGEFGIYDDANDFS